MQRDKLGLAGGGGGEGGDVFLKKNSYIYNTKSDHFSPKLKPYIYGNRKSNAKS